MGDMEVWVGNMWMDTVGVGTAHTVLLYLTLMLTREHVPQSRVLEIKGTEIPVLWTLASPCAPLQYLTLST